MSISSFSSWAIPYMFVIEILFPNFEAITDVILLSFVLKVSLSSIGIVLVIRRAVPSVLQNVFGRLMLIFCVKQRN